MSGPLRVLIVTGSEEVFHRVVEALQIESVSPHAIQVDSFTGLAGALERDEWDLVISSHDYPGLGLDAALRRASGLRPDLPILVLSEQRGEEAAVAAMRAGASDFLHLDDLTHLLPAVERSLRETRDLRQRRVSLESDRQRRLDQFHLQIDRLPLGYLLVGPDFRYQRWNPAAERIFGFREAEALGRHPFELIVPPHVQPSLTAAFQRMAAGDMNTHGSCENFTKDGRAIVCDWHNTPLFAPDGSFEGILSLAQDVTDRRRLEEQFRQVQKMETVGRLSGGIAHDFNNLLTIINGYCDLLLQRISGDSCLREMLTEIHKAGERSVALTRQLLAFSRQQILSPRLLDLNAVVSDSEKLLRRLIGEDIRLKLNLASGLGAVRADPTQLEQVILNLTLNARDAMPTGGALTLETQNVDSPDAETCSFLGARPGPHVVLSVRDTGEGMSSKVKSKIFEPFFTTKEIGKGTGLGLAVVHGIVQQSGGSIAVDSTPGEGTEFRVYLPREDRPASTEAPPTPVSLVTPRGAETILLVEDEDGVRALTRLVLQNCGYTVLEASDSEEALRVIARFARRVDLLVTDVVMPGLGGRDLSEHVRSWHPKIRVLFVSGYTDDAVVRHGVEEDRVAFLQKPFTPLEIAQKVRRLLDEPKGGSLSPAGARAEAE